ncbi:MAG: multifunctional 2-oxoglutarate metabolism enzyme, partial [Frankiaceae bacterium]|nr:multifunctional 2-oxoglutarate metabolism enzyme [Frankiaceae bacterium]
MTRPSAQPAGKSDTFAGFGPNEWLVYEMYQQYLKDPESVDKAWWDFFADYKARDGKATDTNGAEAPTTNAPKPAPTRQPSTESAPASPPGQEAATLDPAAKPETAAAKPETTAKPAPPAKAEKPATAEQPSKGSSEQSAAPAVHPLRGAAARIVANMEASLALPTATSVRAIPAKLLIDNRVVINNHLRRGRGGKVSFTHLIGYAMVKALADYPALNRSYVEIDGKPGVREPEHINLGLAIDLHKDDGSRTLVV